MGLQERAAQKVWAVLVIHVDGRTGVVAICGKDAKRMERKEEGGFASRRDFISEVVNNAGSSSRLGLPARLSTDLGYLADNNVRQVKLTL